MLLHLVVLISETWRVICTLVMKQWSNVSQITYKSCFIYWNVDILPYNMLVVQIVPLKRSFYCFQLFVSLLVSLFSRRKLLSRIVYLVLNSILSTNYFCYAEVLSQFCMDTVYIPAKLWLICNCFII